MTQPDHAREPLLPDEFEKIAVALTKLANALSSPASPTPTRRSSTSRCRRVRQDRADRQGQLAGGLHCRGPTGVWLPGVEPTGRLKPETETDHERMRDGIVRDSTAGRVAISRGRHHHRGTDQEDHHVTWGNQQLFSTHEQARVRKTVGTWQPWTVTNHVFGPRAGSTPGRKPWTTPTSDLLHHQRSQGMTADEQDYCPCGCPVIWSTKHQMTLCLKVTREGTSWTGAGVRRNRDHHPMRDCG